MKFVHVHVKLRTSKEKQTGSTKFIRLGRREEYKNVVMELTRMKRSVLENRILKKMG